MTQMNLKQKHINIKEEKKSTVKVNNILLGKACKYAQAKADTKVSHANSKRKKILGNSWKRYLKNSTGSHLHLNKIKTKKLNSKSCHMELTYDP